METLVLGHPGAERARVESMMLAAGHSVSACHDRSWACAGMTGSCPIDASAVDVAVAIPEPGDRFDTQGVACAFRARIPIVTVGATPDDPVRQYSTANVAQPDGALLSAVEASATDASGHRAAIERALVDVLHPDEDVRVHVTRSSRQLDIRLTADVDEVRASSLADVARSAARGHDANTRVIDVSVRRS